MKKTLLRPSVVLFGGALMFIAVGCSSPAGMAVQVVGTAVETAEVQELSKELMGKTTSAADVKFGVPLDVWREVNGPREWRVYRVSMDVMGNQRYVVVAKNGRIIGILRVAIDGSGVDLARKFMLDEKVLGKTPSEVEAGLGMGPPLVTVRGQNTGHVVQLYNAQILKGVGSAQYCRVLYDTNNRGIEVKLIDVNAVSGYTSPQ